MEMDVDMDVDMAMDMDVDMNLEDRLSIPHDMGDLDNMNDAGSSVYMQLRHVLLPRYLPPGDYNEQDIGLGLMNQMVETLQSLANYLPPKSVELLEKMQQLHLDCTAQAISDRINELRPGDSLAMYVAHQDFAVLFRIPQDENWNDVQNVIVAIFPGSLDPNEIYEREGDVECNYPERAVKVKLTQMLQSEEFANQLWSLNDHPPIRRDSVSKWLISLLMNDESCTANEQECPIITKKIRDEVLGDDQTKIDFVYFRRSSLYMCLKAMLQHSLVMKRGPIIGKLLYKIVMLKFLVDMCKPCVDFQRFNIELFSHMIAKLARRIEKLPAVDTNDVEVNAIRSCIVRETKSIIEDIRKRIDNQIRKMHNEQTTSLSPLKPLDFETDICYKMSKLQEYLTKRHVNQIKTDQAVSSSLGDVVNRTYKRYFVDGMAKTKILDTMTDAVEIRIFWMEFECKVLYDMELDDDSMSAKTLRTWANAYAKYTEDKYKTNKLFISRMLLVRLKLIAMLDKKATAKYPQLRKHKSGINTEIIDCLLLPQRQDMQIAFELEKYFLKRNLAKDPSLIDIKPIDKKSFAVKYAERDEHMIQLRGQILRDDEEEIKCKERSFTIFRKQYLALVSKAGRMQCENDPRTGGHSRSCELCKLQRKIKKMKFEQHVHLLPEDETLQFAIVFELKIPTVIACLRDVLCGLAVFCSGETQKRTAFTSIWTDKLATYNESTSECVKLGSTKSNPFEKHAIDSCTPFSKFIVENISNCVLSANRMAMPPPMSVKRINKLCTLETTEEYTDLQWCLISTQHHENEVLASQSKCGTDLTLSEYKNFGLLRADGHRLQIRKLYAMIETEALSFEKESVFALIMQSLWECGVSGVKVNEGANSTDFVRESHIDFADPKFCNAMIKLLEIFVERQKSNWMHPFKLLTITMIAVRIFEINDTSAVADKTVKLLRKIRSIATEWIMEIEKLIGKLANPDESTESSLRLKLIYIAIIGGATFYVHPKHKFFPKLFQNNDRTQWLHFVIRLKNNVRMYTVDEEQLPPNLIMLIRLMESVGIGVQDKIKEVINQHELNMLVTSLWPRTEGAKFKGIFKHPEFPHILIAVIELESKDQTVTIDIITGTFLVNNVPPSRLPSQIINSPLYREFFGNVVLQVQPDAQRTYSTIRNYNGCTYEFKIINGQIIITEKKANEPEKELIDHTAFNDEFPFTLIHNYTHWWSKTGGYIEFRKKRNEAAHFSKETIIEYRLNLVNSQLIHEQSKHPMLDIGSKSYAKITKQLERLEHAKYIHILYVAAKNEAQVELLRMNLKFTVKFLGKDVTTHLMSNEFSGMIVCQSQHVGTLSGLNRGLILKSASDSEMAARKILLIPNGGISIKSNGDFASVHIDTQGDLQSPPFYQYQVDTFCQQLKSSNGSHASWFYLAYLHAITSHGEIDSFTGMTGTERALQILQSSFAWSSSPYEMEAFKMLAKIAELTPLRKAEAHCQRVQWPKHIPPCAAQDCYVFIAKKLLADSERLHSLHGGNPDRKINLASQLRLNERSHRQYQQLYPNLRVSDAIIANKKLRTFTPRSVATKLCDNTRTICTLYHKKQFKVPQFSLNHFLTNKVDRLEGLDPNRIEDVLNHLVDVRFRNLWITLFDAAVNQRINPEQLTIILSLYANRKNTSKAHETHSVDIEPILALQTIAANPDTFRHIKVPNYNSFHLLSGFYDSKQVRELLKKHILSDSEVLLTVPELRRREMTIDTITDDITSRWPCPALEINNPWNVGFIDFVGANNDINERLKVWYANYELIAFIKKVETALISLARTGVHHVALPACEMPRSTPKNWPQVVIDYEKKMHDNSKKLTDKIEEARKIFKMQTTDPPQSTKYWWKIHKDICNSNEVLHLVRAGLFPRMVPSLILPKLLDPQLDDDLKCLTGAYAMAIAHEQRENRIKDYRKQPELIAALEREVANIPHGNWKPCEYPEWLLFEIEQNVTIRRIQIEIAKRMIDPPQGETKHSVMQLNMGEGKTAVIVPILAARLADGNQACQIVVLKSLFATNLKSLRQYLGGFLNRRIYVFPCRRDMPIESHALEMLSIYKECQKEKGVILTLPEYLLSFQLKIYESISLQLKIDVKENRQYTTSKTLLEIFKWMQTNVRTVLDESDAILHAMYQLVYTVGKQLRPDGDSQRWLVAQALLKRVPAHMKTLYYRFGNKKIEFGQNYGACTYERPDVFTHCRILDESVFDALRDLLIEDFLNGRIDLDFPGIDDTKKNSITDILKHKKLDKNTFKAIEHYTVEKQNIIFILSGLLRFEILKLALTKRWRVNYGVESNGLRKMAIPFKAKDVAAENTEFGHPDVAVCLTQMSYYYSGLTDDQLYQVFHILENSPDAPNIYEKWINGIPNGLVAQSLATYKGINLDDTEQRDNQLFPLLQRNMDVINFWLSNVVYPQELKIFEKKLMCTAWDLCSEHMQYPVTGFSGTNDTKNTLPLTIAQNDLQELENTNEQMKQILLDKSQVLQKPGIVNGKQILKTLVDRGIRVLLDSGAMMLELNNKEVAIEWLKLATDCSAAVYFDEHNTLQTIDRNNIVSEFGYSVHRENLSKCVVYLDDAHTRGTDLKFPLNWTACVTLSGDITRDKTVQSCMRMRQLATTQSILFWPSYEADIRLQAISGQDAVQCSHVIRFIEENSRKFEKAIMVHWTTAALNFTKKIIGHKLYGDNDFEALYEACVDDDFVKLKDMYGEKDETLLYEIAMDKFVKISMHYMRKREVNIVKFIEKVKDDVVMNKLYVLAPDVKKFTHSTDEQQEKELEQETEEETQIQRPPDAKPAQPRFDKHLEKLVSDGIDAIFDTMKTNGTLLSIGTSLANRQMFEDVKNNVDAWADHLFVTKDFQTVIDKESLSGTDFLRPVCWIASIKNARQIPSASDILIILSSFECNHLLPAFRKSKNSTLFMYRPRLSNLHSNLIHEPDLHLTGMARPNKIDTIKAADEAQIAVYSGSMYFATEAEQEAYCGFLGLVPKPWTSVQQEAHDDGIIDDHGFVPIKRRNYPDEIAPGIKQCKFMENPTDLAIKLIKAHHEILPKDSHVASILNRGLKVDLTETMIKK